MALISIGIHNKITGITTQANVPGLVSIELHSDNDGYSSVSFFTKNEKFAAFLVKAYAEYVAAEGDA